VSAHTVTLARTLGWMLVLIGVGFGALLFRDGHVDHPREEMAIALVPLIVGVLLVAGKTLVPLVVSLITAWRTPKGSE
jgi:hypothetical protein